MPSVPLEKLWAPIEDATPGITADELDEWELSHGVKLPSALRGLLRIQNGGRLANSLVHIRSLDEFDFAKQIEMHDLLQQLAAGLDEDDINPNQSSIDCLVFADDEQDSPIALDYRETTQGSPAVVVNPSNLDIDSEECNDSYKTIEAMLTHVTRDNGEPTFEWDNLVGANNLGHIRYVMDLSEEAEKLESADLPIKFDYRAILDGQVIQEWIVPDPGPDPDSLTIYCRHTEAAFTSIIRYILPEPLSKDSIVIQKDDYVDRFVLSLESESSNSPSVEIWTSNLNGAWQKDSDDSEESSMVDIYATNLDDLNDLTDRLYEFPIFR